MFRFTQEPSSGSYFVLSYNYTYGSIVLVVSGQCYGGILACCTSVCYTVEEGTVPSSTVYRTLAQQAGMPP